MNKTLAQIAYEAYGRQAGWLNYLGQSMPAWESLPSRIQGSWDAAVAAAAVEIGKRLGQSVPTEQEN